MVAYLRRSPTIGLRLGKSCCSREVVRRPWSSKVVLTVSFLLATIFGQNNYDGALTGKTLVVTRGGSTWCSEVVTST